MNHDAGRAMLRVCVAARLIPIAFLTAAVLCPQSAYAQLPSPWTGANVGGAAPVGRATYASGTFTIEGGGRRVYEVADQFFFVHRQITGDAILIARVDSVENLNTFVKAGVMIRESLATGSRHAFIAVSPGQGVGFNRRTASDGATTLNSVAGTAPIWVRLVRLGSTITASWSATGGTWNTLGNETLPMASTVYVGLAVSSYNTSTLATATFSNVSVAGASGGAGTSLPAGWAASNVGNPAVSGSSSYASGAYTVAGAGADIWNSSDQFRFVYRQISGDVDVIARVTSLVGPHQWSKAGVMIRSSLADSSAHAFMLVSHSRGLAFQRRPASGYQTLSTSGGSGAAPVWVKLERRGSAVTAFRSANGTSWTMVGSDTLTLPATFYVGLAVTSHDTLRTATAQFTNVTVGQSSASTPPTVSLTSPNGGAAYTAPATVNLAANASDADNGIVEVSFYANGTLIGSDTSSPYTFAWSGVPAGTYSLTATARDNSGATTTSAPRGITVTGSSTSNQPPTVSLTAPAAGSSYTAPAAMTISANAGDADGSIARVDFYAGSTVVGSDTTSPYSVIWSSATPGTYSLTAVARDNRGAATTSSARSITIRTTTALTRAVFGPSPDHATVTRYMLDIFIAGANPSSATPMATQDIGRPAVVNGECTADIAATISGLPGGSYFATVRAVNSAGSSPRTVSGTFVR